MRQSDCIAMILAGGQGSRLGALTRTLAKPAVPFGGKYRIIDFALSNCANSGITTVGVLTQYQPLELNTYIGSGLPWDMDRLNGGAFILPPYVKGKSGEWYKGTANAIYQNKQFLDQFDARRILILSGDHIYKMDYRDMLRRHEETGAVLTIAVIDVPLSEAPRYGILSADRNGRIFAFEEKPEHPASTLASMGIYIFDRDVLMRYLEADENDPGSTNDFGHDVIPAMLADGCPIFAYTFSGYWKDVGTIQSLWAANMDLISGALDLNDDSWRIYSRHVDLPPQTLAPTASLRSSAVTEGCSVAGTVENSVLFSGVTVEEGAVVRDSIVLPMTVVRRGAVVDRAVISHDAEIGENVTVGCGDPNVPLPPDPLCTDGLTLIADGVTLRGNVRIGRGVTVTRSVETWAEGEEELLQRAARRPKGEDAL